VSIRVEVVVVEVMFVGILSVEVVVFVMSP
jgi:hypothetical protein